MILATVAAEASAGTFTELMDHVAQGFEALGAAILVAGVTWSFVLAAVTLRRSDRPAKAYLVLRQAFGGTLLLGLEVLVAADLLRTVAGGDHPPGIGQRTGARDAALTAGSRAGMHVSRGLEAWDSSAEISGHALSCIPGHAIESLQVLGRPRGQLTVHRSPVSLDARPCLGQFLAFLPWLLIQDRPERAQTTNTRMPPDPTENPAGHRSESYFRAAQDHQRSARRPPGSGPASIPAGRPEGPDRLRRAGVRGLRQRPAGVVVRAGNPGPGPR